MSGSSGSTNPADHSKETAIIVFCILVSVGAFLLWRYANYVIVVPAFFVYYLEYHLLYLIHLLPRDYNNSEWVSATLFNHDICDPRCVPSAVNWDNFVAISKDIGQRTYIINILGLFGLAVLVIFKMKGDGFRRVFSLTGREKKKVFRFAGIRINNKFLQFVLRTLAIVFFVRKFLITENKEWVNTGPSLMSYQADFWKTTSVSNTFNADNFSGKEYPARTPAEWLRDNKISLTSRGGLDEAAAKHAFEGQLGPVWRGLKEAPYYVQTIAILSALGRRRDANRDELAGEVAKIFAGGGEDAEKRVKEIMAPYLSDEKLCAGIGRVMDKYAYTNTALVAIYGWSGPLATWGGGKSGIFASSSFLWLKSIDRSLWYALNNVGRRAFHIEGAGVISHFFAERLAREPLIDIYVDSAMTGLIEYLKRHHVVDLEEYFHEEKDF